MEGKQNEELDLSSPHFNAEKALYAPEESVRIPRPNAPILDNLSWFVETEDGIFPRKRTVPAKKKTEETKTAEPSAGPSQDVRQPRKPNKNVLTRMDQTVKGPLSFLKKCMDEKLRVKVYTRSAVSIRGFCLGFVEAFDKHWNLVLKDVFETWNRPRRKGKPPVAGLVTTVAEGMCEKSGEDDESNLLPSSGYSLHKHNPEGRKSGKTHACCWIPRWIVKKRLKGKDVCERHVDQMMIRGEQIVLVMVEPS